MVKEINACACIACVRRGGRFSRWISCRVSHRPAVCHLPARLPVPRSRWQVCPAVWASIVCRSPSNALTVREKPLTALKRSAPTLTPLGTVRPFSAFSRRPVPTNTKIRARCGHLHTVFTKRSGVSRRLTERLYCEEQANVCLRGHCRHPTPLP